MYVFLEQTTRIYTASIYAGNRSVHIYPSSFVVWGRLPLAKLKEKGYGKGCSLVEIFE
jgi:hypothetical protein